MKGVIAGIAEGVDQARVQFRRDGLQKAGVEAILLGGNARLQMEVIHQAGNVGQGNILQQPEGGGIEHGRRNLAHGNAPGIGKIELRLGTEAAEISLAFRRRGHGRKLIHRIARPGAIEIDKEKCFVAAVVEVRNHQRAAQIAADLFGPGSDLGRIRLGDGIWLGVKCGVAVLIVEAGAHAVDPLPDDALHAPKRCHALRPRACCLALPPSTPASSKRCRGRAAASASPASASTSAESTRSPKTAAGKTGGSCASRLRAGHSALEVTTRASKAVLARLAGTLQLDSTRRRRSRETGVLISLAHGAVHQDCVGGGSLPQRSFIRCSTLRSQPGLFLARRQVLIVENHLLKGPALPGWRACWSSCRSGGRSGLRRRTILACAGCGATAGKLPAPESAPARACAFAVTLSSTSPGILTRNLIGSRSV